MRPLAGIRVLDLADEKGELAGRLFADLGADVIRVEPPEGATSRRLPPLADGGTSLYFAVRNAGKRGLCLDLARADGRGRLASLLADADLLIESFAPGHLDRLGLAPARLLGKHPRLVIVSITDFGQTGPYRDWRGTDMVGFAMGGLMHRAGVFEKPPVVAPGALAYDAAGVTGAFAGLLAYWQRLRTGRGQHVDVSVMESAANLSDWALPLYSLRPELGVGRRSGSGIYALYRCADGFVRMIVIVPRHWRALLEWMGSPPELADPALETFLARLARSAEITPVIERFLRDRKKIEVAADAQRRGIPVTPLLAPAEVLANEHVLARGTFRRLEVAPGLEAEVPSGFLVLDGERAGPRSPPPAPGAEAGGFAPRDAAPSPAGAGAGRPAADAAPSAPGEAPARATDAYPLRGLRVLDFGVGGVGVEVGRLLAEYGADVIKVESRTAPDFIRVILGGFMNGSFASSSRSKLGLGVNLKTERGRELVRRLVREADVLIENSATGVMERLGLGLAAARETNPRLVYFSSQMAGSAGPWKEWSGYGPSTHALAGLQYLWNYPEDEERPAGSANIHPDHLVGRLGAFAVLAGLVHRRRSGRGLHADAAQFETALGLLGDLFARESLQPGSVHPQGNASPRGAPWGCYRCAGEDEWCVVTVAADAEWEGLRAALGDPGWARDPALGTSGGRKARRKELDERLEAWTRERSPREAMEALQRHGVPAGLVAHARHHLEDPHLAARGYLLRLEQTGLGRVVLEGPAFHGTALPEPILQPAPLLGEHTRRIARERLGLSDREIEELLAARVLEEPPEWDEGSSAPRAANQVRRTLDPGGAAGSDRVSAAAPEPPEESGPALPSRRGFVAC